MIADSNENLNKNVCLFLNELTGYGFFYSEEAINQRKALREEIISSCLETIQKFLDCNSENSFKEK